MVVCVLVASKEEDADLSSPAPCSDPSIETTFDALGHVDRAGPESEAGWIDGSSMDA